MFLVFLGQYFQDLFALLSVSNADDLTLDTALALLQTKATKTDEDSEVSTENQCE
jgi:hypothetical protein